MNDPTPISVMNFEDGAVAFELQDSLNHFSVVFDDPHDASDWLVAALDAVWKDRAS